MEAAQLVCKCLASYIHEKDEMIVDFTAVFLFYLMVCCNVSETLPSFALDNNQL